MSNKDYPIYYVTYCLSKYLNNCTKGDLSKVPKEVAISVVETKKKGFHILEITPDNYDVPAKIKPFHAGFKHMRDITIPTMDKMFKSKPNLKGFFIAEGDLCINQDYDFKTFLKENKNRTKPVWIGYKKKLSDYVVGNFLLYFPKSSFEKLKSYFENQTQLLYSDRFFTRLTYGENFIDLPVESRASEIEHESKVKGGLRKSSCHLKLHAQGKKSRKSRKYRKSKNKKKSRSRKYSRNKK